MSKLVKMKSKSEIDPNNSDTWLNHHQRHRRDVGIYLANEFQNRINKGYIVLDSDGSVVNGFVVDGNTLWVDTTAILDWSYPGENFDESLWDWTIYNGTTTDVRNIFKNFKCYKEIPVPTFTKLKVKK